METSQKREIKSFVRRAGRMSKLQKNAIKSLSDLYCISFKQELVNFDKIYNNKNDLYLEIGFGMGHATVRIAEENQEKNYLGIEVHAPGVGKLLSEIHLRNLNNIRIVQYDAVEVINQMIPDNSFSGVHIFFPDPWPKKRHHKRRLINETFITSLLRKIKIGGYLYIVTDWEPYAERILNVLDSFQSLVNPYNSYAEGITWRPATSFERKGIKKNHLIRNIWYVKGYL